MRFATAVARATPGSPKSSDSTTGGVVFSTANIGSCDIPQMHVWDIDLPKPTRLGIAPGCLQLIEEALSQFCEAGTSKRDFPLELDEFA